MFIITYLTLACLFVFFQQRNIVNIIFHQKQRLQVISRVYLLNEEALIFVLLTKKDIFRAWSIHFFGMYFSCYSSIVFF